MPGAKGRKRDGEDIVADGGMVGELNWVLWELGSGHGRCGVSYVVLAEMWLGYLHGRIKCTARLCMYSRSAIRL
jgi:hypothetical protein